MLLVLQLLSISLFPSDIIVSIDIVLRVALCLLNPVPNHSSCFWW